MMRFIQMKILKNRKEQWDEMQTWDDETQAEFRSMKTADEAEAWLASKGYAMA